MILSLPFFEVKIWRALTLLLLGVAIAGFLGHLASTWDTSALIAPNQSEDRSEEKGDRGGNASPSTDRKPVVGVVAGQEGTATTKPSQTPVRLPSEAVEKMEKQMEIDLRKRVAGDLTKAAFFNALPAEKQREVLDVLTLAEGAKLKLIMDAAKERRLPSKQQIDELRKETDQSVRAAVGDKNFADYQQHVAEKPHRSVVNLMNQSLAEPVDQQTSDALVKILGEEMKNGRVDGKPAGDPQSVVNGFAERAVGRATEVLNPEQVEALRGSLDRLTRRPKLKK